MGFSNFLDGIVGNVDKAILCIRKLETVEKLREQAKNNKASSGAFDAVKGAADAAKGLANKAQEGLSTLNSLASGDLSALMKESDARKSLNDAGFIPYKVNYNPESIRLYSTGEGSAGYNNDAGGNSFTQMQTLITQNKLSFSLVFEAVNNTDAFSAFGQGFNAETIYGLGKNLLMGDDEKKRVLNHTQGFLSLLPDTLMQDMIFVWSDMSFRGNLIDVDLEYKMFNTSGDPIIAVANMTLQALASKETESDKEYWKEAKKNLFSGKNVADSPYKPAGGLLSSLLS